MKRLFLLGPLLLSHCAPRIDNDDVAHKLAPGLHDMTTPRTPDTAGITVPILRAPGWEARHGKPLYSVMADGSYIAWYQAGPRYLQIVGTRRPGIFRTNEIDGTVDVLGQTVGYFGTGNEDPEYTTNPIRLTHPSGKSANYLVIHGIENRSASLGAFPELSW